MAEYIIYRPKKVLNTHKHVDSWFWTKYTANPYIGCEHGCEYCYAREAKYCPYDSPDLFSEKIKVKENGHELLLKELKNKPKNIIVPGFYQPVDKKYRMMRKMLEVCLEYGFPVLIIEKSPLILQDIDLLKKINKKSWAGVLWSFSEYKSGRETKIFEPRTPTPEVRFQAMKKLSDEGIYQGVAFMPVLPFISDTDENFEGMISETKKHNGRHILIGGLTLSDAQKDRYLYFIKEGYPKLYNKYVQMYKSSYGGPHDYFSKIALRFQELCKKYDMKDRFPRPVNFYPPKLRLNKKIAEYLHLKTYECELLDESKYKYWAYLKAAWGVDEMKEDIRSLYESMGVKGLEKIPGVGKEISKEIEKLINQA